MVRMKKKFLRRDWNKIIRLGGRRKKLTWRRATGAHNKIRQKWKGYSKSPSVGYKAPRKTRGFIENKKPIKINNMDDLITIKANEIGILSSTIGRKKRIDLAKKAVEINAHFANFDAVKFLEEIKKHEEKKKTEKTKPVKKGSGSADAHVRNENISEHPKNAEHFSGVQKKEEVKAETKTSEETK